MREEEEPNWFARWEEELPNPDELMPLSQTLITPDLAVAFDIPTSPTDPLAASRPRPMPQPPSHLTLPQDDTSPPAPPGHGQYDTPELGGGGGGGGPGDDTARTLKRPRLVWTPQLHKRFVDAVGHLGIKNAVPKTIMQLMNVDGLTRENVASHLQKYRLYLKRMQGLPSGAAGAGGPAADAATEHLFASAPVPHHFLSRGPPVPRGGDGAGAGGGGVPDQFVPFVQVSALQHHQQMAAAAAAAAAAAQQQHQHYYHHQRHMGHMGSPPGGGFDHGYLMRQQPAGIQRAGGTGGAGIVASTLTGSYAGDLDQGAGAEVGRRKELTLFPTGDE